MTRNDHKPRIPLWGKVLVALFTAILLFVASVWVLGIVERGRWERYAVDLRDAGEPLTMEEIEALRTELPDEQNSALVIQKAVAAFLPFVEVPPHVLYLGGAAPDVDLFRGLPSYVIEDSRAYLQRHQRFIDALTPILDMPFGRVPIDYSGDRLMILSPDLGDFRRVSKAARLAGIIKTVDGDFVGAAEAAVLQFNIAGSMNQYPSIMGRLVEVACGTSAVRAVEDTLRAGQLDDAELVRICHAATVRLDAAALRWGLWMERAFLIWVLDSAASGDTNAFEFYGPSSLAAQVPGEFMPEFLVRRNEINGVRLLDRLLNALDDPGELLKAATDFDREIGGKDLSLSMARVMIGSISRVAVLHLRGNAELECMIAGVAAERFRVAAGRWPASLDQLTPTYLEAVPVDPFAHGGTIKLARTERGITIYSCGEDREDDGGEVVQDGIHSRAPDVGFRLVDPKHRGVMITDEPRPEEDRPSGR